MSGAPRMDRRRIAPATSSALRSSSSTSRHGSSVWSIARSAPSSYRSATSRGVVGRVATTVRTGYLAPRMPTEGRLLKPVLDAERRGLRGLRLRCGLGRGGVVQAERLLKLARLVHLGDDVAAADELAVDEQLRDRGPVRERRQLLADPRVG